MLATLLLVCCIIGGHQIFCSWQGLKMQDGHLEVLCDKDKNITLQTSGRGYIHVNSDNILEVTEKVKRAKHIVERFKQNDMSDLDESIQRMEDIVNLVGGRVERLENISGIMVPGIRGSLNPRQLFIKVRAVRLEIATMKTILIKNECRINPCRNGGTCLDRFNGFHCLCLKNWEGPTCENDVNECANFEGTDLGCQNNAICTNLVGSYKCECREGWIGMHCTTKQRDCATSRSEELCANGYCFNQGGKVACMCHQGWSMDLSGQCTVDVDECAAKKPVCEHDPPVTCYNTPGSFHCGSCPRGYSGNGRRCADINECEIDNGGCSKYPKVQCFNTQGSRVCGDCPIGYSGDGVTCQSTAGGLCSYNNGGCYEGAICIPTSSFGGTTVECRCPLGFSGDGIGPNGCNSTSAVGFHVCSAELCKNGGTCIQETVFTHHCQCPPLFTGIDCSIVLEDECSNKPCQNGGICKITSTSSIYGFKCFCGFGFIGELCEVPTNDCVGSVTLDFGTLAYPFTENSLSYSHSELCHWEIHVNSTKLVRVSINSLKLSGDVPCSSFVQIYDGSTYFSKSLMKFCSSIISTQVIKSTTNIISIYANLSKARDEHFELSWNAIDASCVKYITITNEAELIESPGYPSNYSSNLDCFWHLTVPEGKLLQFIFYTISIEHSPNCHKDYLKVFGHDTATSKALLQQFCDISELVSPLASNSHQALLYFHTDQDGSAPGFRIGIHVLQGCGGILSAPSGEITPPLIVDTNTVRHQNSLNCEWRIQLPINDKIKFWFTKFDVEECTEMCNCDYLEIHNGPRSDSPLVGKYCGDVIPIDGVSSSNTLTVLFHSDILVNKHGFIMNYETHCGGHFTDSIGELMSPYYPNPYPHEITCEYFIEQPIGKIIKLQVQDFDIEELDIEGYQKCFFDVLEIRDGHDANASLIDRYCGGKDKIPTEIISKFNQLYLKFSTDDSSHFKGFRITYSTMDVVCGGISKDKEGMISSPLEDGVYPPNTRCNWLIVAPEGYVIHIDWVSFHLVWTKDCYSDYVEVYENSTSTGHGTLLKRLCGLDPPPSISSTKNVINIIFHSDGWLNRDGFKLHYIILDAKHSCGGTFHSVVGEIMSPNFPNQYPSNKECIWIIQAPVGQQIRLNVHSFKLEGTNYNSRCTQDVLEVRNGGYETSPMIGQYCGEIIPSEILSFSNTLYVKFTSDGTISYNGFNITWDSSATGCGGVLTAPSGSIISPNFPRRYDRNADCVWRISIAEGSKIELNILELFIEHHPNCEEDYVEVYDGLNTRAKLLGRYCSTSYPPQLLSSDNHLYIKFVSDAGDENKGFHMNYTAVCNTQLKGHHGVIESLNFPGYYPANMDCNWNITAPASNNISIIFSHFDLETVLYEDCGVVDFVEISDKPHGHNLGKYCGNVVPSNVISTTGAVYIHFHSDPVIGGSGFRLEWFVKGCGGVFKNPEYGYISSPDYTNPYPPNVICEWYFDFPFQYSIQFHVSILGIDSSHMCVNDSLKIYGGPDDKAPLLANLCNNGKSDSVVSTSGSRAFIRFSSDDFTHGGRGFFAQYTTKVSKCGGHVSGKSGEIFSHNYPNNYETNEDCEWLVSVDYNHLINLTFVDFDVEPSEWGNTNAVLVYDGLQTDSPVLFNASGKLDDLTSRSVESTSSMLLLRHITDESITAKGFRATYHEACGARILDATRGYFHQSSAALDIYCHYHIISSIPNAIITLTTVNVQLKKDMNISVYDGETEDDKKLLKVMTGNKAPPAIMSTGPAMTIKIYNPSRDNLNFAASYSVYDRDCGGSLTSEYGTITSPKYPEGYPGDTECVWRLDASTGNRVMLTFSDFSLEKSPDGFCNEDYVEIRHKDADGDLLGLYCGDNLPTNITVSDSIWVKFRSDMSGTAKGFAADYALIHGNDLEGPSGVISSPLYPSVYHGRGTYTWTITVRFGYKIEMEFSEFYISHSRAQTDCLNKLKIYEYVHASVKPLLVACGTETPKAVTSTRNRVHIELTNQLEDAESSFFLHWKEIPPPSIYDYYNDEECSEVIRLDNKPGLENYTIHFLNMREKISSCKNRRIFKSTFTWIIEASMFYHLLITFDIVNWKCMEGNLYVYTESEDGSWKNVANQCNGQEHKHLTQLVAKRRLKLIFEIYEYYFFTTGLKAVIKLVCGGEVNLQNNASLNTYNFSFNKTFKMQECVWKVLARPGKTIRVIFKNITLPLRTMFCSDNYVVLRNGAYEDSPYLGIGKYCGTVLPPQLETSSNKLHITLKEYNTLEKEHSIWGISLDLVEVSQECGQDVLLNLHDRITISTPGYPNVPPPHVTCIWRFIAPAGYSVYIEFNQHIMFTKNCDEEYLELRDGSTEDSHILDQLCYQQSPKSSIVTESNVLYIKYFSDMDVPLAFTSDIKVATCGGTQFIYYNPVSITSPEYPDKYLANSNCTWHVKSIHGDFLTVKFLEFDVGNNVADCKTSTDYVEIIQTDFFTNQPIDIIVFCGHIDATNSTSSSVQTKSSSSVIRFVSGAKPDKNSKRRFSLQFDIETSNCRNTYETPSGELRSPGFPNGQNGVYCSYTITVAKGRRIKLKFLELDLDKQTSLHVYQGNYIIWSWNGEEDLHDFVLEATSNEMAIYYSIFLHSIHRGFKAEYSSDQPMLCGGDLDASGVINFPGKINFTYGQCIWERISIQENTTFSIDIQGTLQSSKPRMCSDNNVTLYFTEDDFWNDIATLCGHYETPVTAVRSPYLLTKIVLKNERSNLITTSNTNFTLTYKTYPCGGVINSYEANVTITSPGYPDNYPANMECAWLVKLMEANQIRVAFDFLDVDPLNDFVSIYIDEYSFSSSHIVGKYRGTLLPQPFTSSRNGVWIIFHSDSSIQGKGFMINITTNYQECGGIEHSNEGYLSTPGYMSERYQNNIECEWEIHVDPGYHIGLTFSNRFHLENSTNCTNDYVKVFDYIDEEWIPVGNKVCGRPKLPFSFNTTTNRMKVLFHTNEKTNGDGFSAMWNVNCGARIIIPDGGSGTIISPNFPDYYDSDLSCRYEIIANSRIITGEFTHFELEPGISGDCVKDNLTVIMIRKRQPLYQYMTWRPSSYNPSGRLFPPVSSGLRNQNYYPRSYWPFYDSSSQSYCGSELPPPVRSQNKLILKFQTDYYNTKSGFFFKYTTESCGAPNITEPTTIVIPNDSLDCIWVVNAPKDKIVILRIHKEIPRFPTDCSLDYIKVWTGPSNVTEVCSYSPPMKLYSIGNNMTIVYHTQRHPILHTSMFVSFSHACGSTINLTSSLSSQIISSLDTDNDGKYEPNLDCHWLILAPLSYTIKLTFTRMDIDNTTNSNVSCSFDYIKIYDGDSNTANEIGTFCGSSKVPSIMSSMNEILVIFVSDETINKPGFRLTVEPVLSPCGVARRMISSSKEIGTLTSPGWEQLYHNNLNCSWILATNSSSEKLHIHFVTLDIEKSTNCSKDRLEITDIGVNKDLYSVGLPLRVYRMMKPLIMQKRMTVCGQRAVDYYSSSNTVLVRFTTDSQITSKGFKLEYSFDDCHLDLVEPYGRIYKLQILTACRIYIKAPHPNNTISLYFTQLDIHYSRRCNTDNLQIFDGSNSKNESQKIGTFCGTTRPKPLFSTGPDMLILYSPFIYYHGTFDMLYTTTDQGKGCGGRLFGFEGTFSSPLDRNLFSTGSVCRWDISVPHGYSLHFTFIDFNIGSQNTCDTDYLEIKETETDVGLRSWKYCGQVKPDDLEVKSDAVFVRYVTSIHNNGTGWEIMFSSK